MKVDLVMWTLNGEKTLQLVLSRINQIIPKDIVNQRLIVDDGSKDNTVNIAKKCGWTVLRNEGKGISDAANTALKHAQTSYFCSFEQDVLLSRDWWNKVSTLILNKQKVAAACGLRFLPRNNFCFSIEPYQLTRKDVDFYGGYGKTLDNTIWNTEDLRSVGGFPKVNFAGIDTFLFNMFKLRGYKWLVDYDVRSLHLHYGGLLNEFKHYYFYGLSLPEIYSRLKKLCITYENENLSCLFLRFLKSPISSLKMALRMHDSRLMFSYPIIRLCWLLGYIRGTSWQNTQ
ncbi:MAG: glycosyltransferase family A protein [Candidatus Bathyarchaeia archaeon]